MGKNDMMGMQRGWGYPVCDECGMTDAMCGACATPTICNTANTCNNCDETCAVPAPGPAVAANGEMHVYFDACDGMKEVDMTCDCQNDESVGRVLDVNVKLCNACPGRSSAVGVTLVEVDGNGNEYARGFRAVSVPAHNAGTNRDVALPVQRFIVPENLNVCGNRRHFIVRTTNHYLEQPTQCGW